MAPIYEFYCPTCGKTTEEIHLIDSRPEEINCECGQKARYGISSSQFTVNGANAANRYSGDSNYKWMGVGPKK